MYNIQTFRKGTRTNFDPKIMFLDGSKGVYFNMNNVSSMFQDTSATTPAISVNSPVARINDLSGNGNNAIQSTSGNRATIKQSATGRLCLEFNGSNTYLATSIASSSITTGITFFSTVLLLSNPLSGGSNYQTPAVIGNGFAGNSNDVLFGFFTSGGKPYFRSYTEDGSGGYNADSTITFPLFQKFNIMMYVFGNTIILKVGNSDLSVTGTSPLSSTSLNPRSLTIGAEPNYGGYLNCQISNIVLVEGNKTNYWNDMQQWMTAN